MASQPIGEVFFAFCKTINSPVSLGCWLRFKYNQRALSEMKVRPKDYLTAEAFSSDYACVSFLRKYEGLRTDVDTEANALISFAEYEAKCKETNSIFRDPKLRGISPRVHSIFHQMKRKIAAVLGPLNVSEVLRSCKWGPGATATIPYRRRFVDNKISEAPLSTTYKAKPYITAFLESDPHWFYAMSGQFPEGPYSILPCLLDIVRGDVLVVVPKDATTGRTIGKTPTANSFLQQGPGQYIRRRLKAFGVDLDDQSVNQTWAELAFSLGLCTLDLKGASDTVAKEMVFHFLPLDWALFLDELRSPFVYRTDTDEWTYVEKFSAMGTAFTFELESLLFWAALSAVTEAVDPGGVVSVYGDDLICTQSVYAEVCEVLSSMGFIVNYDKSHFEGYFYESCGKHYWAGEDVTPAFQKEVLRSGTHLSIVRCHNRLYRLGNRSNNSRLAAAAYAAADCANRLASKWLRTHRIPCNSEGDDGFLTPILLLVGEYEHQLCENHGILCRVLLSSSRRRYGRGRALLAHALRKYHARDLQPLLYLFEAGTCIGSQRIEDADPELRSGLRWIGPHVVLC